MTCSYILKHFFIVGPYFTRPAIATFLLLILQHQVLASDDVPHPTGQLINIGTHSMHLFCAGRGSPTVILDAGLGGFSLEWIRVQNELAKQTKVCAYDRSGYGWSETSPYPRTSTVITGELFKLLKISQSSRSVHSGRSLLWWLYRTIICQSL